MTPAKVTLPRLPRVFRRRRTLALLDKLLGTAACVWIEGPPGAGKTTLALEWVTARRRPAAWYQIDAGDEDLATFFHYLGLAIAEAIGSEASPLPALTPEYQRVATFTRRYFETLARLLPPRAVLVLDNVQEVKDGALYDALSIGVEQLGPGQRLLCLSRAEPPAAFARARTHGSVAYLGWDDLQLTAEEARGIARLRGFGADRSIDAINEQTRGWTAGLLLMLERPRPGGDEIVFERHRAHLLFDYFAGEIFSGLPEKTREVLLKTAFFSHVSAEEARSVSGVVSADDVLRRLAERNYFTIERGELDVARYEYHPLFRAFLRASAEKCLDAGELHELKLTTASLLAAARRFEEAAVLYREIAATRELSELILRAAPEVVPQGRYLPLREWLDWLPPETVASDPWLTYWQGAARLLFDPAASEPYFVRAYELFQQKRDGRGVLLAWSGVNDAIFYRQLELHRLAPWLERLDRMNEDYPAELHDPELCGRVAGDALRALLYGEWEPRRFAEWAARGASVAHQVKDLCSRVRLCAALAAYYDISADGAAAAAIVEAQAHLVATSDGPPGALVHSLISGSYSLSGRMSLERSLRSVDQGLSIIDSNGLQMFTRPLICTALFGILCAGSLQKADELLEIVARLNPYLPENGDAAHFHGNRSWRLRFDGKNAAALHHALEGWRILRPVGSYLLDTWSHYFLSHAYLDNGEPRRAREEAELARAIAEPAAMKSIAVLVTLQSARIAFAEGNEPAALAFLEEGLATQDDPRRYGLLVAWLPEQTSTLYAQALAHGVHTGFVRKVIRTCNLSPPESSSSPLDAWPFPLRVHTLGRFTVLVDDEPLVFQGKAQKKPLELLKALIALGGRSVREDQLTEALWPDAEADDAARSLTSTLHRLRKLVGEGAILRQEGRLTLDARRVWVDLWAFERRMSALRRDAPTTPTEDLVRSSDALLTLYRGSFLQGDDDRSWALAARARVDQRFLAVLELLGNRLADAGRHPQALACFEKALEVAPHNETVYRALMRLRAARQEQGEVVALYRRCRQVLAEEFGCAPSAETEALVQSLAIRV